MLIFKTLTFSGVPKDVAEDIRQSLYLRLLLKDKFKLTDIKKPHNYAFMLARNAAYDYKRTKSKIVMTTSLEDEKVALMKSDYEMWLLASNDSTPVRISKALVLAQKFETIKNVMAFELLLGLTCGYTTDELGKRYGVSGQTIRKYMNQWRVYVKGKLK